MNQQIPLPDCYQCGRPAAEHSYHTGACPRKHDPAPRFVVGALLAIAGALVWYATRTDAALCSSGLVSALAPSQCDRATAFHDVAALVFLGGLGLVIAAFIRGRR